MTELNETNAPAPVAEIEALAAVPRAPASVIVPELVTEPPLLLTAACVIVPMVADPADFASNRLATETDAIEPLAVIDAEATSASPPPTVTLRAFVIAPELVVLCVMVP